MFRTLSKTCEEDALHLAAEHFQSISHWLAGGLIMQNPHGFIMQSPNKTCCNFYLSFEASLLLEIQSPSPPPSPPLWHSLFLPVYLLLLPFHTTFVAIHLTKAESSSAFGSPVCLSEHLLTSNYWSCHVRESSVWCRFFYCLCWR